MRPDEAASRSVIATVASLLEGVLPEMVFVGGHVAGLLVTTPILRRFRATLDVDLLVRVVTRAEFGAVEERLRGAGMVPDSRPGAPICRWLTPGGIGIRTSSGLQSPIRWARTRSESPRRLCTLRPSGRP